MRLACQQMGALTMPTTTRAAVLRHRGAARPYADSRPLSIETLTLDDPGPGEVLVAIKAAGLCHSDLSVINGDRPPPPAHGPGA